MDRLGDYPVFQMNRATNLVTTENRGGIGELNFCNMVDAQIAVVESELLRE